MNNDLRSSVELIQDLFKQGLSKAEVVTLLIYQHNLSSFQIRRAFLAYGAQPKIKSAA